MVIEYTKHDLVKQLKECMDVNKILYVAFKECDFNDGDSLWKIYIDRGRHSWNDIMSMINKISPVHYRFVSNYHIDKDTKELCYIAF